MSPTTPSDTIWLAELLAAHDAVAGSVHRRQGDLLVASAYVNIPRQVQALIATIPEGKGMAGLAWRRRRPVLTCNLEDDETGDVRPGAKAVDARAAAALPIFDATGAVVGVVGFAFADERPLPEEALAPLQAAATRAFFEGAGLKTT